MKKYLRIMEGLAINIGFMLFGYFMLIMFYSLFVSPYQWISIRIL